MFRSWLISFCGFFFFFLDCLYFILLYIYIFLTIPIIAYCFNFHSRWNASHKILFLGNGWSRVLQQNIGNWKLCAKSWHVCSTMQLTIAVVSLSSVDSKVSVSIHSSKVYVINRYWVFFNIKNYMESGIFQNTAALYNTIVSYKTIKNMKNP